MPDTAIEHRMLTQEQLGEEARARFGPDPLTWAFQCPRCGDIATAADFPPDKRERVGQECVGRYRGALAGPPTNVGPQRGTAERGCDWTAYGLIPAPWTITMPNGHTAHCFPLAPAPEAPTESTPEPAQGEEGADTEATSAYWSLWATEDGELTLASLHEFSAQRTAVAVLTDLEHTPPIPPPSTFGEPHQLEPLTRQQLLDLRELMQNKKPVTWKEAHPYQAAERGVACRHCGCDESAHTPGADTPTAAGEPGE